MDHALGCDGDAIAMTELKAPIPLKLLPRCPVQPDFIHQLNMTAGLAPMIYLDADLRRTQLSTQTANKGCKPRVSHEQAESAGIYERPARPSCDKAVVGQSIRTLVSVAGWAGFRGYFNMASVCVLHHSRVFKQRAWATQTSAVAIPIAPSSVI